jgi:hypothetical protein
VELKLLILLLLIVSLWSFNKEIISIEEEVLYPLIPNTSGVVLILLM